MPPLARFPATTLHCLTHTTAPARGRALWLGVRARYFARTPLFDNSCRNSYHKGMKTIVSEKGQITIPKPLRIRLGIRVGQVLEVKEEDGHLVMSKQVKPHDAIDKLYGILKLGRSTDQIMEELRGSEKPR